MQVIATPSAHAFQFNNFKYLSSKQILKLTKIREDIAHKRAIGKLPLLKVKAEEPIEEDEDFE